MPSPPLLLLTLASALLLLRPALAGLPAPRGALAVRLALHAGPWLVLVLPAEHARWPLLLPPLLGALVAGRLLLALLLALPALLACGLAWLALLAAPPCGLEPLALVQAWAWAGAWDLALLHLTARLAARRGALDRAQEAGRIAGEAALLAALPLALGVFVWPGARALAVGGPVVLLGAALLARALVGLPARLLLRPGPGTPGPRELLAALYTLLTLAGGGLLLLRRLRRLPAAERERAALDGMHLLAARFVAGLPLGRRRAAGVEPGRLPVAVYVANHESIFDVMALLALPVPLQILVKEWVWRRPVLGPVVQAAGYHLTDKADPEQLGAAAAAALGRGISLLVFPEGARSRDGRLGRFKNGAFLLARSAGVPLVPVALVGTREAVRPGSWWVGDHDASAVVLDPLRAAAWSGDLPDRAAARAAREAIRAARDARWLEWVEGPRWRRALAARWRDQAPLVRWAAALRLWRDPLLAALPRLAWGEGQALVVGAGPGGVLAARLLQGHPERPVRVIEPDPARAALVAAALGEPGRATVEAGDPRRLPLGAPALLLLVDALGAWPPGEQPDLLACLGRALPRGGRALFRERCAGRGARPVTEWARLLNAAGLAVESTRPELGRRWQVTFVLRRA